MKLFIKTLVLLLIMVLIPLGLLALGFFVGLPERKWAFSAGLISYNEFDFFHRSFIVGAVGCVIWATYGVYVVIKYVILKGEF